jgi:hypothetical protein
LQTVIGTDTHQVSAGGGLGKEFDMQRFDLRQGRVASQGEFKHYQVIRWLTAGCEDERNDPTAAHGRTWS